ncbi:MAG: alpha/beta hydrolase [Bdellovibrionales bacterium]|nr:alpha/beta hydrolase [Bdellovibrionales bacterium]
MIRVLLLLVSLLASPVLWAAPNADIGSCDTANQNSGCITVIENPQKPEDGNVQIYYQWLEKPNPAKKTFLFLNGGPGGSIEDYLRDGEFWKSSALGKNYNVLFFDPRGVGKSSPITRENVSRRKLQNYRIENLISDIEELRLRVAGRQQIGLIGHSFGGHLLFAYASRFPASVSRLISLHGGATSLGFVSQAYLQNLEWTKATDGLDPLKLTLLKDKVQAGQACSIPDERPLPPDMWRQIQLVAFIGDYEQRRQIGPLLAQSIRVNIDQNKSCPYGAAVMPETRSQQESLGLNVFANSAIVCHSFLTERQIQLTGILFRDGALRKRDLQCRKNEYFDKADDEGFDYLEHLRSIDVPMLIVGGENDQVIAPLVQHQVWNALSAKQRTSSKLVIIPSCGHRSHVEAPQALSAALAEFLE